MIVKKNEQKNERTPDTSPEKCIAMLCKPKRDLTPYPFPEGKG
jgi:hypothetical protein